MTAQVSKRAHSLDGAEPSTCPLTPRSLQQSICISYLTWPSSFTGTEMWRNRKRNRRCCIFNPGHRVVDFFWQQTALTGMLHRARFFHPGALLLRSRRRSARLEPGSERSFSIKYLLHKRSLPLHHSLHMQNPKLDLVKQLSEECQHHKYALQSSRYHRWMFTQISNCFRISHGSFWKTAK